MIHFIVATSSEARPIIDIFNLNKTKIDSSNIYNNDEISLTISGIGKINSAVGVTQTFYEFKKNYNNIWINIGLAGHKFLKIGDMSLVHKIKDNSSQKSFFTFVGDFDIQSFECLTCDNENKNYSNDLFDMECSGFFESAKRFSTKELIQSLKIVSDNQSKSINFKNKKEIYDLIFYHRQTLKDFSNYFLKLRQSCLANLDQYINEQFDLVFNEKNFTFTESQQMKLLLKFYFTKFNNLDKSMFNPSKNGSFNIKIIKKFLNL
tara:strand:- start:391 stop:1179 length:789 start_codon:yes stop_codon:yes gene_type:complete